MRQIAISDIHGCPKTLMALLDKLAFSQSDTLFLLGDVVDKGPDSKGVLDALMQMRQDGYNFHCLLGNHEEMLLDSRNRLWQSNSNDCLDSFEVNHAREIPAPYYDFMHTFEWYLEVGDFLLVHAGFDFSKADPLADKQAMLWIRDWYDTIDHEWLDGRIVLHGHTPMQKTDIQSALSDMEKNAWMDIDAGCSMGGYREGLGNLCAFDMTNRELFFEEFRDAISE